jgi:Holliday junction resolvase-like predicted endonuclease
MHTGLARKTVKPTKQEAIKEMQHLWTKKRKTKPEDLRVDCFTEQEKHDTMICKKTVTKEERVERLYLPDH